MKTVRNANQTKTQTRRNAQQQWQDVTGSAGDLLGEIVSWNCRSTQTITQALMQAALDAAGLDKSLAKDLSPTAAFGRALRQMKDERLIDIAWEDSNEVCFQFTNRVKKSDQTEGNQELEYKKDCKLILNKTSGQIRCKKRPELQAKAQQELNRCLKERTTNDVTQCVQRLFEKYEEQNPTGALIPIRDQGGVYIVLAPHIAFAAQVHKFLEELGGQFSRFPTYNGDQGQGARSLQQHLRSYLEAQVDKLDEATEKFDIHTRPTTLEEAVKGRQLQRVKAQAYAAWLGEEQAFVLKKIDKSDKELTAKIEQVTEDRKNAPPKSEKNKGGRTITQSIIDALENGPITKEDLTAQIQQEFPDKRPEGLAITVRWNIATGLPRRGWVLTKTDKGFIAKKDNNASN
jgi:hypothetical protein